MGLVFTACVLGLALSAQFRTSARAIARDGALLLSALFGYVVWQETLSVRGPVGGPVIAWLDYRVPTLVVILISAGAAVVLSAIVLAIRTHSRLSIELRPIELQNDRAVELERTFVAAWGTKVLVLAALTLVPFGYSWKVRGEVNIPLSGLVFIAYHGIGGYIWMEVRHIRALDGIPTLQLVGDERRARLERLLPWQRRWRILGYFVWPLLALSLLRAVHIAGFNVLPRDSLHWLV